MKPSSRGKAPVPRVPSPGALRPYTPSDLSSIPHMDGTPLTNQTPRNSTSNGSTENATDSGPYIVGSPIDLGNIDNIDNIGITLRPLRGSRRRTREHIELQETGQSNPELEGKFTTSASSSFHQREFIS